MCKTRTTRSTEVKRLNAVPLSCAIQAQDLTQVLLLVSGLHSSTQLLNIGAQDSNQQEDRGQAFNCSAVPMRRQRQVHCRQECALWLHSTSNLLTASCSEICGGSLKWQRPSLQPSIP